MVSFLAVVITTESNFDTLSNLKGLNFLFIPDAKRVTLSSEKVLRWGSGRKLIALEQRLIEENSLVVRCISLTDDVVKCFNIILDKNIEFLLVRLAKEGSQDSNRG